MHWNKNVLQKWRYFRSTKKWGQSFFVARPHFDSWHDVKKFKTWFSNCLRINGKCLHFQQFWFNNTYSSKIIRTKFFKSHSNIWIFALKVEKIVLPIYSIIFGAKIQMRHFWSTFVYSIRTQTLLASLAILDETFFL